MNTIKGILLSILVFIVTVPCLGRSGVIKRKKNKWLHAAELTKPATVNRKNQTRAETLIY
jgi:hypothetical protein